MKNARYTTVALFLLCFINSHCFAEVMVWDSGDWSNDEWGYFATDYDGDGFTNDQETILNTAPLIFTDFSTLRNDADSDGIIDDKEIAIGTNPNQADSDSDGLSDDAELLLYCINANSNDSDGDGLLDNLDPEPGTDAQCTMPMGGLYKGSVIKDGVALP